MTIQEIEELAGHRQVPAWVVKLVGDAVAAIDNKYPIKFTHEEYNAVIDAAVADGAKMERKACAEVCNAISIAARKDWKAKYNPHDDGRCDGAFECEEAIRARG